MDNTLEALDDLGVSKHAIDLLNLLYSLVELLSDIIRSLDLAIVRFQIPYLIIETLKHLVCSLHVVNHHLNALELSNLILESLDLETTGSF